MTGTPAWQLVAGREIRQRMRSKAFVISSLLIMAFAVAGVVISAVVHDDARTRVRIALVDDAGVDHGADTPKVSSLRDALPDIGIALSRDVLTTVAITRTDGEALLRTGKVDVLIDGTTAVWNRRVDAVQKALVQAAAQSVVRDQRAKQIGLDNAELDQLVQPVSLNTSTLHPRESDDAIRAGTAGIGLVLLFLSIQIHGAAVLMGVVEEKSSRVVEVLLGHVRPRSLLVGKITGIGIVGLTQVLLVASSALLALVTVRSIDAPKVPADAIGWFVVWFVLGFALYATIFAGLGSLVSRQEDAQSVVTPATVPLLVSYFIGFAAVASPNALVARIASLVPLSAPMVMPVRIAAGSPAIWEIALSLALVAGTIVAVVHLAGRVYERNVLRSGPRGSLATAWRSARSNA